MCDWVGGEAGHYNCCSLLAVALNSSKCFPFFILYWVDEIHWSAFPPDLPFAHITSPSICLLCEEFNFTLCSEITFSWLLKFSEVTSQVPSAIVFSGKAHFSVFSFVSTARFYSGLRIALGNGLYLFQTCLVIGKAFRGFTGINGLVLGPLLSCILWQFSAQTKQTQILSKKISSWKKEYSEWNTVLC